MHTVVDYGEKVVSSFKEIIESLNKLCLHVLDDLQALPLWVLDGEKSWFQDRDKLCYILKHMEHRPEISPQETYVCPAIVAATEETFTYIEAVNTAKLAFKGAVAAYLKFLNTPKTKVVRKLLDQAGYGAVKLKQVYRTIPYIDFHPKKVTWAKSRKGSYVKISSSEAKELLLKKGQEEAIDIQLNKLSLLSPKEYLVVFHPIKPCWGVNITKFAEGTQPVTFKRFREIGMPLFYLHGEDLEAPEVQIKYGSPPTAVETGVEKHRSDKVLEDKPFLHSIHAYRYKDQAEMQKI